VTPETPTEIQALPLSLAQRPLWFLQRLDPSASAYNVPLALVLSGPLDAARLRRALETVVERHEALRTTFEVFETEPVQVFHPSIEVPWEETDLSGLSDEERWRAVGRMEEEEASRPFDLARGPLLRSRLAKLSEEEHVWLVTFHHVVFDGWSQEVLLDEVGELYAAGPDALPELPIQYADFATWQEEQLSGARLEGLVDFWLRELDGYPTVLRLPTDRPRPARQSFRGAVASALLPADAWGRAEALAAEGGATPFMLFLAAWMTLLHRISGAERLLVGTPSAGRTHPDAERLIGNFVNTLVVGGDFSGDPSFRDLLERVRERTVAAVAHEELMLDQLVEALAPERHASFSPLVQVSMAVERFNVAGRELAPGLTAEPRQPVIGTAKVDLTLFVRPTAGGVRLVLEHNTDLFDRRTAERWLAYLGRIVEGALDDPDRPVSALTMIDAAERRLLLEEWPLPLDPADAPAPAPGAARWETGLAAAFAARVEESPDAVAVEALGGLGGLDGTGSACLTYAGLDRRSAALAARLAAAGVGRGTPVALDLDRSPELVVAVLAVVRAGGAYVPLDRSYPEERRRLMIEDADARLLLTRGGGASDPAGLGDVEVLRVDAPEAGEAEDRVDAPTGPDDRAYVIYTSGSTGRPKGVVASHRGVARLALGADYTALGPEETVLHLASISFDAATLEVWGPLLTGGRIALFPAETPSPAAVRRALARHRATRMFLTTALFNQLAEEPEAIPDSLLHLMTGGEQASPAAFRAVLAARPGLALSNVYGPTENTTFSTHRRIAGLGDVEMPPPIGRAIAGSTCWVLDRALRPVPTGALGELLVGGDGLAHGYLGRPALTAERFLPHPFATRPGERLYRTGDLVRWLPDGALEFRGRNDFQVKIRGFRIEPGEVEKALGEVPGVEKALVVVRPVAGDPALVGYYVAHSGSEPGSGPSSAAPAGAVREELRRRLPPFMVPAALVELDAFPVNAQGKVDRSALPEPDRSSAAAGIEYEAPRTPLEEEIAGLWAEVMGVERVGIHDDFFALGGHSLLATRILARLGDDFGVEIPLADLFEAPTVAGLAAALGTLLLEDDIEDEP
jgi:amino acid adenylation domain-containing protein